MPWWSFGMEQSVVIDKFKLCFCGALSSFCGLAESLSIVLSAGDSWMRTLNKSAARDMLVAALCAVVVYEIQTSM